MKVDHHRDLEAWQLADEIRSVIFELTSRPEVKKDFEFCDQSRRASRSACRNIAEGFWRFVHPEFARFVLIARGSLGELFDSADEALLRGYFDQGEHAALNGLLNRAIGAATGLHAYLASTPTPRFNRRHKAG
jgi:four helix bundle protein